MEVVFNKASAYMHSTNIKKWDLCAGNAILNAVGGSIHSFDDKEIDYSSSHSVINENGLLAALSNHRFYMDKILNRNTKTNVAR